MLRLLLPLAAAALLDSSELGCLGFVSHSVRLSEVASKFLCVLLRAWLCSACRNTEAEDVDYFNGLVQMKRSLWHDMCQTCCFHNRFHNQRTY
jgi:hypothetical protein